MLVKFWTIFYLLHVIIANSNVVTEHSKEMVKKRMPHEKIWNNYFFWKRRVREKAIKDEIMKGKENLSHMKRNWRVQLFEKER